MPTPTLYIANSLGFGTHTREHMLRDVVATVRDMGFRVIEPFHDNNEKSLEMERTVEQEFEVAGQDVESTVAADGVLCIVSSPVPDEGAMIEVGIAMALKKPVFYLNDDFRFRPNGRCLPMNLMLFSHARPNTWEQYYYTSLDSLRDPQKALHKWITHVNTPLQTLLEMRQDSES